MNHNFEGKILAFWINAQFYIFFFKDELTSRIMEHLRTKDRDSLLAEIHELRKTSTKPLKEQV